MTDSDTIYCSKWVSEL